LCFVVGRMGSHTAGVCVTGRSVAKSSSAFRVRSTLQEIALQVAVWRKAPLGTLSVPLWWVARRYSSYAGKYSLGISASAKLSTGDFRPRRLSCLSFQG